MAVDPSTNGRRLGEPLLPAACSSRPLAEATPACAGRRLPPASAARPASWPPPQATRAPAARSRPRTPPAVLGSAARRAQGNGERPHEPPARLGASAAASPSSGRERAATRRGPYVAAASSSPSLVTSLSSRPRGQSSRPRRRARQAELEATPPQRGPGRSRLRARGWRGRGRGRPGRRGARSRGCALADGEEGGEVGRGGAVLAAEEGGGPGRRGLVPPLPLPPWPEMEAPVGREETPRPARILPCGSSRAASRRPRGCHRRHGPARTSAPLACAHELVAGRTELSPPPCAPVAAFRPASQLRRTPLPPAT
ncbi:hypothetical protein PVAP13_6NG054530 [Panicum virgatum]|uniref:Uncharacterized protein n=1 Tax=Panicum virgatum TaxID=38727 RepID=A0A8T0QU40_PANVG|nr:hypothetical protein PVAP13_6NG054530 [Panicum virgatum]